TDDSDLANAAHSGLTGASSPLVWVDIGAKRACTGTSTTTIIVIVVCAVLITFVLAVLILYVRRRLRSKKSRNKKVVSLPIRPKSFSGSFGRSAQPYQADAVELQGYNVTLPHNTPPVKDRRADNTLSSIEEGPEEGEESDKEELAGEEEQEEPTELGDYY
ncbi:hypothetical protein, partial [Escherichia coli]|uniref:hypothetical protein n=1 Tax=Escherichia coli TaxID=562 RepID=UPI003C2F376F